LHLFDYALIIIVKVLYYNNYNYSNYNYKSMMSNKVQFNNLKK